MKQYPKHKDSGVEWIGEIPEGWDVVRLKFSTEFINEKIDGKETDLPYLGLENIESWTGKRLSLEPFSCEGLANRFYPTNVLFGKLRPYLAKVYNSDSDGICTTEFLVLKPKETTKDYLFYYLLSKDMIDTINSSTYGVKMPRASWDFIGNLPCLIPQNSEQERISTFLDRRTHLIDTLIAAKRRQIELLKEKRAALITRAVTKGLDPGVKMKDSGIEWLGEIPEGWDVKKIVYVLDIIQDGTHFSPESDFTGDFLYITAKNIKEWGIDLSEITYVSKEAHDEIYKRCPVKKGDVLYIKDGATAGIATVNPFAEPFSLLSSVAMLRPKSDYYDSDYLAYHLNMKSFKTYMLNHLVGGAMTRFTVEIIKRFKLVAPPYFEQKAISFYLNGETEKTQSIITKLESSIEKLQEYRSALITAAVTGKIDLREEA